MIPSIISVLSFTDDSSGGGESESDRNEEKRKQKKKQETHVLESPYNNAGALICCLPSLHRLHLNVSWVSHIVSMLNLNNWRKSSWVKCRAVSSASSTTHAERFCFWHLVVSSYSSEKEEGRGSLSLEDLFFDRSGRLESVNETCPLAISPSGSIGRHTLLLLTISPYSS